VTLKPVWIAPSVARVVLSARIPVQFDAYGKYDKTGNWEWLIGLLNPSQALHNIL
jgi:hypothetical protein